MIAIFLKRILLAVPVLFAVASITFFLIKIAPGGPFDADKAVSPQVLKNLNEAYNLDASNWEQYVDYMTGLIQGDLGPSFRFPGRSVTEMIATGLPVTFELAFYAILIALVMGVFLGVLAALKRNTFLDFIPMAIAMIGICVPSFLMGTIIGFNFWNKS
jgi:oligopeptide transport system permease protein